MAITVLQKVKEAAIDIIRGAPPVYHMHVGQHSISYDPITSGFITDKVDLEDDARSINAVGGINTVGNTIDAVNDYFDNYSTHDTKHAI
jgi:hypothetical protein